MMMINLKYIGFILFVTTLNVEVSDSQGNDFDTFGYGAKNSYETDEWQRYQQKIQENNERSNKNVKSGKKKGSYSESGDENVSPQFKMARTKSGYVVKQLEAGNQAKGSGGFEFPQEPALLSSIEYKFDGSVAPVVRLAETQNGLVGKKLEHSIAKDVGADWSGQKGLAKSKFKGRSIETVNEEGLVHPAAGLSTLFPEGVFVKDGLLNAVPGLDKLIKTQSTLEAKEYLRYQDESYDRVDPEVLPGEYEELEFDDLDPYEYSLDDYDKILDDEAEFDDYGYEKDWERK